MDVFRKIGILILMNVATVAVADVDLSWVDSIQKQIASRYPRAHIEILGAPKVVSGSFPQKVQKVIWLADSGRGMATLQVMGGEQAAQVEIPFQAQMQAWVASKRVMPGEKLGPESVRLQVINVAEGVNREYRGVLLGQEAQIETLETKQSILEGGLVLASGVRRIPDIKRGEPVTVKLLSGEVVLVTSGIVEESGYMNESIRVTTNKTKKQMIGRLRSDRTVEVDL